MSNKVTFDYSRASQFISGHEVELMKKLTLEAERRLISEEQIHTVVGEAHSSLS